MEPRDYVAALRKFWLGILLLTLIGGGAAFSIAKSTPPSYRATSKVFVTVENGRTVSELVQGSTFAQNVVQSYAQLVTMPVVLDRVIDNLGLAVTPRQLARSVSANTPLNTVIIEINAVSGEPQRATDISNAVAASLALTVSEIAPRDADGASSVAVRLVSPADLPRFAFAPNTRFLTASGMLAGLLIGMIGALIGQVLDTKVRSDKDVERVTDTAILGSVAVISKPVPGQTVMLARPRSAQAESYRKIRANLQFVNAALEIRSLVVTSARASEGKSTTITNLAVAMAERGSRVLIIDADLRRPTIATVCGLEGSVGLTTVLIGNAAVDDVLQEWGESGVTVLTSGAAPPNPLQLLDSAAMADLLAAVTERFDIVLIDAPPVLPVADAAVLSRLTNGALVVVGAGMTTRQQLGKVVESLTAVGANLVGVVLSKASKRDVSGYYGYGYHSYDSARSWDANLVETGESARVKTRAARARSRKTRASAKP